MLFGRRKPTPLPEASPMGFRSRLVLAKLGFDLRQRYGVSSSIISTRARSSHRLVPFSRRLMGEVESIAEI